MNEPKLAPFPSASPAPDDPVALTQRLIRFDNVNPPGRERARMEFIEDLLKSAGFATSIVAMGD